MINSDPPWWNLPETMRAAFFAGLETPDKATSQACFEVFSTCHEAYFAHDPNPALMGFPYQTRDGRTGRVVDKVPAIPEGDPLYHSNLCFLEILAAWTEFKSN